jgi:hypothetical protein
MTRLLTARLIMQYRQRRRLTIIIPVPNSNQSKETIMATESSTNAALLGLNLLSGADSFLTDLTPEDEASISGGNGRRRRSRTSRPTRASRPTRRSRRSGLS